MQPVASALTTNLFVALVVVMMGLVGFGLRLALPERRRAMDLLRLGIFVAALTVPGLLAALGLLDRYTPPPPALVMLAIIVVATVALALSPLGAQVARGFPLAALVGYQAFRVPVEIILHRLHAEGVVPVQMTYSGRNFDIVTGVSAILVAALVASDRAPRWLVLGWNVLGLALLVNIVVIAVRATPAIGAFAGEPPNLLPSTLPFVWLPSFLVPLALLGHLLVFRALTQARPAD